MRHLRPANRLLIVVVVVVAVASSLPVGVSSATAVLPMEVTLTPSASTIPVGGMVKLAVRIRDLDGYPTLLMVNMGNGHATYRYVYCYPPRVLSDSTEYFSEEYFERGEYTITVSVRSDICLPIKPEYVTKTLTINVV